MLKTGAVAALTALVAVGAATAKESGYIFASHAGVTCAFGTGDQGRGALCGLTNGKGYKVTVTDRRVVVWKGSRALFSRAQP